MTTGDWWATALCESVSGEKPLAVVCNGEALVLFRNAAGELCAFSYPRFRPGYDVPNLQPFAPVGRHRSRCDVTFNTTAAPIPLRYVMPRIAFVIQPQDNSVIRPQNERYFDPDARLDLHSCFDAPGTRYRFLVDRLVQRRARGDFSYGTDAEPGRDISALPGMVD